MSDKDNVLELFFNGNIDAANAQETLDSIDEMLSVNPHSKITIDMSDVKEVTDDGLKALKSLGDKSGNVELTNVADNIYEVFEKNGLTDIIPIQKKMKIKM